MELSVVELFAGVGGFRVGLNHIDRIDEATGLAEENGNWKFVWANQWEPSTKAQPAFDCYTARFGLENHNNTDINRVDRTTIPNHSLLVGGFPCQDYSVARTLSNEKGIQGKKGVLWWDIADVLYEKYPPFVLLENVDRLLKSPARQRGRDFAVMLKTFQDLGYIVQWRVINAGEYGMPQRRRRVFIFASLQNLKYSQQIENITNKEAYLLSDGFFNEVFPIRIKPGTMSTKSLNTYKDVVDISDKYSDGKFSTSGIALDGDITNFEVEEITDMNLYTLGEVVANARKYQKIPYEEYLIDGLALDKWKYLKGAKQVPRRKPDGSEYFYSEGAMSFPDLLDLPSRTMLTGESTLNRSSHIIYDDTINGYRRITEIEAELLQMFPPNWTNTGMTSRQRYFMMGNALVTGIISKLEKKLARIISEE